MSLEKLTKGNNQAVIEHEGDEKFLVLYSGKDHNYILISSSVQFHMQIEQRYAEEISKYNHLPCGGGRLAIDKNKKTIRTYDKSRAYGSYHEDLVKEILEETHPDYKLMIEKSGYI